MIPTQSAPAAAPGPATGGATTAGRSARRTYAADLKLLIRSASALASLIWLLALILIAAVFPLFITDAANHQDLALRFLPPFTVDHGLSFVLGADSLGRPILLQLIVGARTSLLVAACTVALSALVGTVIGIVSGYYGGWADTVLMRLADILHTVPSLLLALAVLYVLQPSITNLVLVLAVTRIPVYLRTARAQTLELRERVFVESSRSIGASDWRIMAKDITPMVTPTMRTLAMLEVANVILAAASLSFLGIGLQRPDVDWGMMVSDGRSYLSVAWWVTVFPGLTIVATALAANLLSNWLRAIEDPTQRGFFVKPAKRTTKTARS
ncbi:ABC transporter permease [Mycolicibacterium tokaiense]|uniref:Binding-protein-dependent transport system inner membrane protein n=1 Tax=Mycolicibacterium tokaiense TaxID=39695 RepID=A0A378TEG0_9MYCO|nr:ABC transporter permease [Mycolicibacterium tokaiense]BBY87253.1 ABC transporter permease [Mycolicibacterium tokaiense]STZ58233.1 binding-protein-dependent transport system inner membrane protein [Mycolicibacterium tokaiense]